MLIELYVEGGFGAFPGLAKPIKLDSASLSPDLDAELQRRLAAAEAEAQQRKSGKSVGVPDGRRYRLVVHVDMQHRQIDAADPTVPPAFVALMEFVKANGRR
jgi:hypothetical protein